MNHIISAKTGISYKAMKEHSTTDQEFEVIEQWYDWFEIESNLKIYDIHECQTLDEILYFIPGNEIVFIDYLQLVKLVKTTKKKDFVREQDVAEISRSFKLAALQHQIPLVIGAQLNRDVDKRPGHIPVLGDLRESGSIEQDADNVYFPVRPSYYDEIANPDAVIPYWQKGHFTMRGAKGRDTGTDNLKFHMDMLTYKFTDGHLHTAPEPEFNVGNMKI
jgi:replicative DNA helicase